MADPRLHLLGLIVLSLLNWAALGVLVFGLLARLPERVERWRGLSKWCGGLALGVAFVLLVLGAWDAICAFRTGSLRFEPAERGRVVAALVESTVIFSIAMLSFTVLPVLGFVGLSLHLRRMRNKLAAQARKEELA